MASESLYLRAIIPTLPSEIAQKIRSLCTTPANEIVLENLVRFLSGGEYAADTSKTVQEQWFEKQRATQTVLTTLLPNGTEKKRPREDESVDQSESKKQRISPPTGTPKTEGAESTDTGKPLYTLHSLSATSPVRKKVDITITTTVITLTNPASRAIEATIPRSSIKRAFIVPTRGKSKPHWTVILLSSDVPDKGKVVPGVASENQQVIFGVDATPAAPFTTTSYIAASEPAVFVSPKATDILPFLHDFLMHINVPVIEPSVTAFRSACPGIGRGANSDGIPGVEAYRAAKAGNLWFAKEGVLWGESKPCEFWPVEDLLGKTDGLRIVGSGRTCSVILTRRPASPGGDENEEDEDTGEETEFGMIDGKEREGINEWVRNHRHLFGRHPGAPPLTEEKEKTSKSNIVSGPLTIRTLMEGSDSEDEDFSASVSDLDGSELSTDESSDGEEGGGGDGEEEGGEEEDDDVDAEGSENDMEDDGLNPENHPLLQPGAMPKMSKAALEMAVGIIENDFVGGPTEGSDVPVDDEVDELDD